MRNAMHHKFELTKQSNHRYCGFSVIYKDFTTSLADCSSRCTQRTESTDNNFRPLKSKRYDYVGLVSEMKAENRPPKKIADHSILLDIEID